MIFIYKMQRLPAYNTRLQDIILTLAAPPVHTHLGKTGFKHFAAHIKLLNRCISLSAATLAHVLLNL